MSTKDLSSYDGDEKSAVAPINGSDLPPSGRPRGPDGAFMIGSKRLYCKVHSLLGSCSRDVAM